MKQVNLTITFDEEKLSRSNATWARRSLTWTVR